MQDEADITKHLSTTQVHCLSHSDCPVILRSATIVNMNIVRIICQMAGTHLFLSSSYLLCAVHQLVQPATQILSIVSLATTAGVVTLCCEYKMKIASKIVRRIDVALRRVTDCRRYLAVLVIKRQDTWTLWDSRLCLL